MEDRLRQLKQERYNFNAYQFVFSEVDAMDYGPRYFERADIAANEMYDRLKKINEEIAQIEGQLNNFQE
mgnify:CR=1 FL=1